MLTFLYDLLEVNVAIEFGFPFPVEMHQSLYEGAIDRHGQYVRWYSSIACPCVDDMGRANPQCNQCLGRGYRYFIVKKRRRFEVVMSMGGSKVSTTRTISSINRLFRGGQPSIDLSYTSFSNKSITLSTIPNRGTHIYVDYEEDLTVPFVGRALYLGNGIIQAVVPPVCIIQGQFVGVISDILYLKNLTKGTDITLTSFWDNYAIIDVADYPDADDVLEISCIFVQPVKFLVNQITMKQRDQGFAIYQNADASCSFPGYIPAGKGDLITLMKAEQKDDVVAIYSGSGDYLLPVFSLSYILRVEDNLGEVTNVQIVKQNQLRFNGAKPNGRFSVSFFYKPTFIMAQELPSVRYAENKVMPKRVSLKKFDNIGRMEATLKRTVSFGEF